LLVIEPPRTISGGYPHSLAIKSDGSLWAWGRTGNWAWGRTGNGQLGMGFGPPYDFDPVLIGTGFRVP
jgi:hypothetical protein